MEDLEKTKIAARRILKNEIKQLQLVPSVAIKLLELTHDDTIKISDLSRIIETEPTLAVKILHNVNSAAYALPNKITSVNRAVHLLGFSAVRRMTLAQLFYNKLINLGNGQKFDQLFFWQHSLFVASLSKEIAIALKHPDPDLVYTAGLIHDIGKIVLETYGRSSYSEFVAKPKNRHSFIDEETDFFGLTHAEIGHVFCLEWQIPAPITAVVTYHHHPPDPASPYAEFQQEIAIVSCADYIAWMQGVGSFDDSTCQPALPAEVLQHVDIDRLNLDFLLQHVDREMEQTREFYGIRFPSVSQLRATLVKAALHLGQTQPDPRPASDVKERLPLSSLTAPHQSLNPDEFLPGTLEAVGNDFALDRVMLLTIHPKRRCLVASHCWPVPQPPDQLPPFEIDIGTISGLLLDCLREKKSILVNSETESGNQLLIKLNVAEYIAVPVLHQQRLMGVLYADQSVSRKLLSPALLADIAPVAAQLGIALVNARHYQMEKRQAELDPLTQLYNKRMVNRFLAETFQQTADKLAKIAIGFIDIDRFKQINDSCGHQAGDEALKIVAEIMGSTTRPGDFIGRYGGEEFIFLLKNTNAVGAQGYAERIRAEIERRGKALREKFHGLELTASIGVATYQRRYAGYADMIEAADQAMYQAKKEGRNRIVIFTGGSAVAAAKDA